LLLQAVDFLLRLLVDVLEPCLVGFDPRLEGGVVNLELGDGGLQGIDCVPVFFGESFRDLGRVSLQQSGVCRLGRVELG